MIERKELSPKNPQILEETRDELFLDLSEELDDLVSNDPNAPYLASRKMSLAFQVKQLIRFGGHFPASVAYYTIAIIGSVIVLCSGYSEDSSHNFVWLFVGSSLAAQVIEVIGKSQDKSGNDS